MGAIGSGHLEIALDLLPLPISQAKAVFTSGLECQWRLLILFDATSCTFFSQEDDQCRLSSVC